MIKTTEFELLKATIQSYALLRIEFTTSASKIQTTCKINQNINRNKLLKSEKNIHIQLILVLRELHFT